MMARRITKVMLIGLVALSACYYDSEEDLNPQSNCVTTDLSFRNDIVPILERNCYRCHSAAVNTANITLEGYSQFVQYTTNGRLLGAIRHDPGFKPMPQGASKLIACDIAKIELWIAQGSPNN